MPTSLVPIGRLGSYSAAARNALAEKLAAAPSLQPAHDAISAFRERFRATPDPFPHVEALQGIAPILRTLVGDADTAVQKVGALMTAIACDLVIRMVDAVVPPEELAQIPLLAPAPLAQLATEAQGYFDPEVALAVKSAAGRLEAFATKAAAGHVTNPRAAADDLAGLIVRLEQQDDQNGKVGRELLGLLIGYLRVCDRLSADAGSPVPAAASEPDDENLTATTASDSTVA